MSWVVEVLCLGGLTDEGALWMVEEIVGSAVACGLLAATATATATVHAYRTVWHGVYGDPVFRPAREKPAEDPARTLPRRAAGRGRCGRTPAAGRPQGRWSAIDGPYDVAERLDAVLTGLLSRGTRSATGAPDG
ncbi:hypothetical protein [Streptomyces sp. NPDC059176]|uniref:hypothetical protein n=1 Tax=unclassified Streptomyces TaxID=2593676 RepID=UPI0036C77FB1